jgi:uncharacterized protein
MNPYVMHMLWHELAFLHWPVAPAVLQPLLPAGLQLDTFEGMAWIAVVPFRMSGIRGRFLPPIPGTAAFLELNVRTYVLGGPQHQDKPGVWFFSLDAEHPLAVRAARLAFYLPYMDAQMQQQKQGHSWHYHSTRTHWREPSAIFQANYRPSGPVFSAQPASLEHWLTERYCLYSADQTGRVYRGDIWHQPWPLQPCEVELKHNSMTQALGIALDGPPLAHYAERLAVTAALIRG